MVRPLKNRTKKRSAGPFFSMKMVGNLKKVLFFSLPYVLSLTAVGLLLGSVMVYAMNSPTFQLTEVRILNLGTLTQEQAFKFCELKKGESLINLNLVNVQQVIKTKHPEFKEVRVRRVLPNRIEVVLRRRTPVAQVAFSRYVQIDKDLVILPGSSPTPFKNLIVVEGVPIPRQGLYVGATLKDSVTKKALTLATLIVQSPINEKYVLTKIDVSDPRNMSFYLDHAVEVRIGNSHFADRLKILTQALKSIDLDVSKISYIDLRFDSLSIGPR